MKKGQRLRKQGKEGKEKMLAVASQSEAEQQMTFSDTLREELNKKKTFTRRDGSLMQSSELRLIAIKVIQELRTTSPVNSRLLDIVLNRIEGKPKEFVEVDATMEVMNGLNPTELLLQRLSKLLPSGEADTDNRESES